MLCRCRYRWLMETAFANPTNLSTTKRRRAKELRRRHMLSFQTSFSVPYVLTSPDVGHPAESDRPSWTLTTIEPRFLNHDLLMSSDRKATEASLFMCQVTDETGTDGADHRSRNYQSDDVGVGALTGSKRNRYSRYRGQRCQTPSVARSCTGAPCGNNFLSAQNHPPRSETQGQAPDRVAGYDERVDPPRSDRPRAAH